MIVIPDLTEQIEEMEAGLRRIARQQSSRPHDRIQTSPRLESKLNSRRAGNATAALYHLVKASQIRRLLNSLRTSAKANEYHQRERAKHAEERARLRRKDPSKG